MVSLKVLRSWFPESLNLLRDVVRGTLQMWRVGWRDTTGADEDGLEIRGKHERDLRCHWL